jgi:uncharacterized membrane protein
VQKYLDKQQYFKVLIYFLLAIGIFFRCYNIDSKLYWHDEVYTSIRTAGYNGQEIVSLAFNGEVISPSDLVKYQKLSAEKTWEDTLDKLIEHPEHPPLYYLLSRGWQELFGSSIAATRSLSVFFSLLLFPVIYWLCQELFNNPKVGWWTIGIIAVSPVQVLYAQEAREYSLLVLTTAITCLTLLRAVKRNNWLWWGFYAVSLATNFYISLIAGYIAIAQAIYIVVLERFRITKITINFILSGIASLVLFAPWLWVILSNYEILQNKTSWTKMTKPFIELFHAWELHLSSIFIDLHPTINGYIASRILGFLIIFISICYRLVCRQNKPQTWLLLLSITIVPTVMLILPDLINGEIKSIMTRYFLTSILMIQIVVAYWLSQIKNWRELKRSLTIFLIVTCGIISCGISSQSVTWWNKVISFHNATIAEIINSYERPLLIANTTVVDNNHDVNIGDLISLSYLLDNKVDLLLYKNQNLPSIDYDRYDNVLLWDVKEESRIKFQEKNNWELEIVEGEYYPPLWQRQLPK